MAWQSSLEVPAQPALPTVETFADDLMPQREAAAFLKMSLSGFLAAVNAGRLPEPINYGAGPRWSKAAIFKFIYARVEALQTAQKH